MIITHKKLYQASLLVALSAILYGFLGYLGTIVIRENISISTMLFWRFSIAALWIFLFVIKKSTLQNIVHHISKRALFFTFILGAIGYAGSSGFFFIASQYTGTGLAMVIFFSYPIIVALESWIRDINNFSLYTLFTLIAMIAGLYLLRDTTQHEYNFIGIFFGVISAICYSFYVLGSKYIAKVKIDSTILTAIVCLSCAFIFLILSLSTHTFVVPHTAKSWIYLSALGVLATAIPIQLMLEGLKYITSMRASIISVLEPLITLIVGMILLNEVVTHSQILGAVIILTSAILVQFHKEL